MEYDLIKVTKEEYAIDILKGKLYMNPLSFFRECENDYMGDVTELLEEQGHLCAYCMRRIDKEHMKIRNSANRQK